MPSFVPDAPTQGPSFVPDEPASKPEAVAPSFVPDKPKKVPTYDTVYDAGVGFSKKEFGVGDKIIVGGEEKTFAGLNGVQQVAEKTLMPSLTVPRLENAPEAAIPGTGIPLDLAAAGMNVAGQAASTMTAPAGAVLLPLGAGGVIGKGLNTLAGIGFSGTMASEIPDQVKEAAKVLQDPNATRAQKLEAAAVPGVTALFSAMAGAGAVHEARTIGKGVMPEVKSAVSQPDVAPVPLPSKPSLVTTIDSIEGNKHPKAMNTDINAAIMAPKAPDAMPVPAPAPKAMPNVGPAPLAEVLGTKGAKQRELALKAQDPEKWAYLDEQRKVNGPDRMTQPEFDRAVKDALNGLEKPAENPDLLPASEASKPEAVETPAPEQKPATGKETAKAGRTVTTVSKLVKDHPDVAALLSDEQMGRNKRVTITVHENEPVDVKPTLYDYTTRKILAAKDGKAEVRYAGTSTNPQDRLTFEPTKGHLPPGSTFAVMDSTNGRHSIEVWRFTDQPKGGPQLPASSGKTFVLPKALAGAKPRYGMGSKLLALQFDSDLDKALYIISQTKKSKSDGKYLSLVMDHLGLDEAEARAEGVLVRQRIKQAAKGAPNGEVLVIPSTDTVVAGTTKALSDPLVDSVSKMDHQEFADFAKKQEGGFTTTAIELGQRLGKDSADALRERANAVRKDFEKAMKDGDMQQAINLSNKSQFFSESAQAAEGKLGHDLAGKESIYERERNKKTDAIQIESAGKVDVQSTPGNGEALGSAHQVDTGLTQPRESPREVPIEGQPKEGDVRNGPPLEPPSDLTTGEYDPPLDPNSYQYKPGLTAIPGLGDLFKVIKKVGGIVYDNVYAANRRLGGVLKEYEFGKTTQGKWFEEMSIPLSRLARKAFTKHGIDVFGRMLMNGDIAGAKALANEHTRVGPEISASIDNVMKANDKAFELQQLSRGEENVTYRSNYFARKIRNYDALMEFLNERERGVADKALAEAQKANGDKALSREEQEIVLNNLIRDSSVNKSKPGYLKPRTIEELDAKISKFYEPFDVAMEDHYRKVTNDYYDRLYFGKQKESYARGEGKFGEEMAKEIMAGRLSPKAQNIVADNLRARFALQKYGDGLAVKFAEKMRLAQTGAYLGQISVAAAQFMDILNTAFHVGWMDTARGYTDRKFTLRDIGVHEGNVETTKYAAHKTKVDEAIRLIVKVGTGLSDQFNKGGMANAFAEHYSRVIAEGKGREYQLLEQKYRELYPNTYEAMFKAMKDREFDKGDAMSKDAKMFIFSELSDMHPLNPSGMAQGYNAANGWVKPVYGLKSYWLKQLGLLRTRGYELLKDKRTRDRGILYLAAYSTMVAAGQNVIMQYIRDKMAGHKTDVHEALVGGYLQLAGLSRYNIGQVADGHLGDATLGFLYPAAGLVREAGNDLALTRDSMIRRQDKSGRPLVKNGIDYLRQSQLIRHTPLVGTILYQRYGRGKIQDDKRNADIAKGKNPRQTIDDLKDMIYPGRKTTDRK